jgi:hypothetical protein
VAPLKRRKVLRAHVVVRLAPGFDGQRLMANTYNGNKLQSIPQVTNAVVQNQAGFADGFQTLERILGFGATRQCVYANKV